MQSIYNFGPIIALQCRERVNAEKMEYERRWWRTKEAMCKRKQKKKKSAYHRES